MAMATRAARAAPILGAGVSVAPLFVYLPGNWWDGAYLQIWRNRTKFFSGNLDGEGSFNLDFVTGLKKDWNVFSNVTGYF